MALHFDAGEAPAALRANLTTLPGRELPWNTAASPRLSVFLAERILGDLEQRLGQPASHFRATRRADGLEPLVQPEPYSVAALRKATAQLLEACRELRSDLPHGALISAAQAVGEFGFAELAGDLEAATRDLPPLTSLEVRRREAEHALRAAEAKLTARHIPGLTPYLRAESRSVESLLDPARARDRGMSAADLGPEADEIRAEIRTWVSARDLLDQIKVDFALDPFGEARLWHLRVALELTRRQLRAWDDQAALRQWAGERASGADWAFRRLQALDLPAADAWADEQLLLALGAARAPRRNDEIWSLGERWPIRLQRLLATISPVDQHDLDGTVASDQLAPPSASARELRALLDDAKRSSSEREAALHRLAGLVVAGERSAFEELRSFGAVPGDERERKMLFQQALALRLRLAPDGQFDSVLEVAQKLAGGDPDVSDLILRLAPLVRGNPARRQAILAPLERAIKARPDPDLLRAALVADAKALQARLSGLTRGKVRSTAVTARQILALWAETDAFTRGRLLAAAWLQWLDVRSDRTAPLRLYLEQEFRLLAPRLSAIQRADLIAAAERMAATLRCSVERQLGVHVDEIAALLK